MARSIDSSFYRHGAWIACRSAYLKQHPLCERCLERGIYTPAVHVHHVEWLNANNFNDPNKTLGFDNLQALCHKCHNQVHAGREFVKRRYEVDELGKIIIH